MRELSLHILDLAENSLRAEATRVTLTITADPTTDRLVIELEDDGTGLTVSAAQALDPFYTTKLGKRTGLGLSLFRAAAERAAGTLRLAPATSAAPGRPGLKIIADMQLSHLDRSPLGDLAATLGVLVCTQPGVDFRVHLRLAGRAFDLSTLELTRDAAIRDDDGLALARRVIEMIRAELQAAELVL